MTTAATVWLTAAVGMAAGSGLWLLAVAATGSHLEVESLDGVLQVRAVDANAEVEWAGPTPESVALRQLT